MRHSPCVVVALVALVAGCAGREVIAPSDASSTSIADATDATNASDAGPAFDLGIDTFDSGCPQGLYVTEGEACSVDGLACPIISALSCPEGATCVDGGWQIHCPLHPFGTDSGSCGCAHPS